MTFDELVAVTEAVVSDAAGRVPVVLGGQTTSTRELVKLARTAAENGADFMQVSAPFYFAHTEDDFCDYVAAALPPPMSVWWCTTPIGRAWRFRTPS